MESSAGVTTAQGTQFRHLTHAIDTVIPIVVNYRIHTIDA